MRISAARLTPIGTTFALTAIAGGVDAIAYTRVTGVFPANQSGNLILLGVAAGGFPGPAVWRTAGAVAAFLVGVLGAARAGERLGRARRPALLSIELVLVVAAAALAGPLPTAEVPATVAGLRGVGVLVLLGSAMGVQTEVIGRVLGVGVRTTFQSGALTRVAESVGRPAHDPHAALVLTSAVALYVGGATAGAALAARWGWALAAPAILLAALVLAHAARPPAPGPPAP